MDQNGEYMIETATETHKHYELIISKTLLIIVPMSILSFVFSYVSGFDFGFSYNVQFSTLIFSHALDRKYAFLLCNGILAFLAKNLSFSSFSNGGTENMNPVSESKEAAPPEENEASAMIYHATHEEKLAINSQEQKDNREEGEERENRVLIIESEEEDEDDEDESGLIIDGEEEGINDDVKISTEELNKKFEEFIRKMKEEIRIEAQLQQIITV